MTEIVRQPNGKLSLWNTYAPPVFGIAVPIELASCSDDLRVPLPCGNGVDVWVSASAVREALADKDRWPQLMSRQDSVTQQQMRIIGKLGLAAVAAGDAR